MEITEELIEQTYLFCYKRLDNPEDARDLAQDILCEALQAIAGGREIYHFYSWYWKMARNRYAVKLKHRNHKAAEYPIEDYLENLMYEGANVIDEMVLEEEFSRMHSTIAHLAGIHREVLVQYYIKEKSIKEIAECLSIPEGTVKRRLFDAKQEAREEMKKMPRVTELSYAPNELEIWASQALHDKGVFKDLLAKQILAVCYEEGKAIPELSKEIQVASVYLEEKMEALRKEGLMKRDGRNKYLTNFIIFSKNVVTAMLRDMEEVYMEMCELAYQTLNSHWEEINSIGFYGITVPKEELYIIFLPVSIEALGMSCVDEYQKSIPELEMPVNELEFYDYQSDRIMGQVLSAGEEVLDYEVKALECKFLSNVIETVKGKSYTVQDGFCMEPFSIERIRDIHGNNIELICELSRNPGKELTEQEELSVGVLIKKGIVEKREGGYYPNVVIFEKDKLQKIHSYLSELLSPYKEMYTEKLTDIIHSHLLPHVRKDLLEQYYYYVVNIFLIPSSVMMWWAKEKGIIAIPDNPEGSYAGMYIIEKS